MTWQQKNTEMSMQLRSLNKAVSETSRAFSALSRTAKAEGALDKKTKEFVALGIAVSDRCEPCIGFHVEALVKLGATRDEIAGVLEMCIQMGGGPSLMYAAKTLACYDELTSAESA